MDKTSITVAQLIEMLQQFPQEYNVLVETCGCDMSVDSLWSYADCKDTDIIIGRYDTPSGWGERLLATMKEGVDIDEWHIRNKERERERNDERKRKKDEQKRKDEELERLKVKWAANEEAAAAESLEIFEKYKNQSPLRGYIPGTGP